ncbi:histidine kinase dimerization/phospho-acceptor domain-containing protein [Spirochaeta cellobiosiphila]|uniref:ATP-binding protein n=1 Tax=Spirochaeta cellobiosiphila TaxID=504483 RepID=UPI0004167C3B|nr:histidine kinase dimerization/phospho-acceptor domain-containing protein [Spirochaeta cellobiosiphila]
MRSEYLPFLRNISEKLLKQQDWKKVIAYGISTIGRIMNWDEVIIARSIPNQEELTLQEREHWVREGMDLSQKTSSLVDDFALNKVPSELVDALKSYESYRSKDSPWVQSRQLRSIVVLPIVRGNLLWGALLLINHEEREELTSEDYDFLWSFSGIISSRLGELDVHSQLTGGHNDIESNIDMFFSQLTHDLKTPLNGILGYTQVLLRKGGVDEFTINCLNLIDKSGQSLLSMIDNILAITRGDSVDSVKRNKPKNRIEGLSSHREQQILNQTTKNTANSGKLHYSIPDKETLLQLKEVAYSGDWKALGTQLDQLDKEFETFKGEAKALVVGFHVEGFKAFINQLIKRAS